MSVVRIVFLGTPEFAKEHLRALVDDDHYKVVGVVTQPDRPSGRKMKLKPSPVKELAIEKGIEVISPEKITDEVLDKIHSWRAEAAVVVAFGQILSQKFLDIFPYKVVNVHGSLLPRWRGAAPIQRAIMAGDKVTGVALQVMVKKLDAGDVLGVRKIEINENTEAIELHDKMIPLGCDLLHVEFMDYLRGNLTPVAQDEMQATYAHKISKSESLIDWSKSAQEISQHIRGMKLGPGCYTLRDGNKLKIHNVNIANSNSNVAPGEVIALHDDAFVIACGQGALKVLEVQPESKSRMPVRDYLKGYELKTGEILGEGTD